MMDDVEVCKDPPCMPAGKGRASNVGLLEPFHQRAGYFLYVDKRAVQRVPGQRSWSFTWTDLRVGRWKKTLNKLGFQRAA